MIQSFRHKGLKRLFENGETKGIRADYVEKTENILAVLNRARSVEDMNLPGFRLHPLKGARGVLCRDCSGELPRDVPPLTLILSTILRFRRIEPCA